MGGIDCALDNLAILGLVVISKEEVGHFGSTSTDIEGGRGEVKAGLNGRGMSIMGNPILFGSFSFGKKD